MTRRAALTVGLALTGLLGAAAWSTGANRRFFDYDEIYHAHATWQISKGLRPFHDFQASHSPLLWYPLAAFWRLLPESPAALIPLRYVAACGTLLSVAGMVGSLAAVHRELPGRWLLLGLMPVVFNAAILDYGLEFRPDSWATALLFGAFVLFLTGRPSSLFLRYACFGGLSALAILASPKFVALPVLFVVLDVGVRAFRRDGVLPALLGTALGTAVALLATFAWLRAMQIDPALAFDMAIRYQWEVVSQGSHGQGLLGSVMAHPWLLTLVVLGIAAWSTYLVSHARHPAPYEIAVVLFLLAQLVVVDRPYKQYFAPWFLVGACFVPFIGFFIVETMPRATPLLVISAFVVSAWTAASAFGWFARQDQARGMLDFYDALLRVSPADAAIVAYPPLHPIVRHDVFYGWSRTTDPAGHGTEAIMDALALPGYSQRFAAPYYQQEIEARPPAVVVAPLDSNWGYEPKQWAVLRGYLDMHRDRYVLIDRGVLRPFWLRRDLLPERVTALTADPR